MSWMNGRPIMSFLERRAYGRTDCVLKTHCQELSDVEYKEAYALDISDGGMRAVATQSRQAPALMQIQVELPERPYRHLVLAKLLHCRESKEPGLHEMRLKFIGLLPKGLKNLVTDQTDRDGWPLQCERSRI